MKSQINLRALPKLRDSKAEGGYRGALLIYNAQTEQGFRMEMDGVPPEVSLT